MQDEPLVSIIINCYNGEKFLKQTLLSVLNQSYKNLELIFWDNKSTDNSKKIYNLIKDNRCKYYSSNKHTNLVLARHYALKKIKGDYFCFLDADDVWLKDKIFQQVELLVKENAGFAYSNSIIFNNNKKKILFDKEKPSGNIYTDLLDDYFVPDETVLFSRKILLKNKIKFNERLNYIPNFDLTMQYAKISKAIYCNKVLAKWRVNNTSLTWKKNKEIYQDINNWLCNQKKKENNGYIKKKIVKAINKNHLRYARSLLIEHGNVKTIKFLLSHFNINISFLIMFFISCMPFATNFLRFRRKKLFLN
jgi:glycosyltransferase involved in cell wall biosynthesis